MDQDLDEEKVCDICGDIGVDDAILNCALCRVNCEHMYCMKIPLEEPSDDWICEECESSSKPKPQTSSLFEQGSKINPVEVVRSHELPAYSKKFQNEATVGSANWEKRVDTGKTKYLPVKEALMLSSVDKSALGTNKFERPVIRRKTIPISFSFRQDLASGSSQQPKLQRLGNTAICEKQLQLQRPTKLIEVPRSVSSLQPSQDPKNRNVQKELPREIQWAQTKARRLVKKQSCTPGRRPITISGINSHTTNELRIRDAENMNNNVMPDLEKCSCNPALDVCWKGSFNIQDDHRREELNPQIQAHPPSRVRRKIYEFSMKMPDVLHFQLVSADTSRINVFNEFIPDEKDIALYFFPSVGDSILAEYISLLESISRRHLALREQIDDIELFVFTSKLLPVKFQCVNGNHFLWGVFRHLERDTTACLDNRALELSVQSSLDAIHAHNQVDDPEEVDMDVDMIGGNNVGRVDIPVKRESLGGTSTSLRGESTAATALPGMTTSVSECSITPSLKPKLELHDLIPPGFEEVFKRRISQDSSSSMEKSV